MQKRRYNGGSLVKQYKGIVDLDARAYGNQDFQGANVTATRNLGSSFTGSIRGSANSKGRSSPGVSLTYNKSLGKGFNLTASVNKDSRNSPQFKIRIAKPL